MVMIPEILQIFYLSRHCFPVRPGILYSSAIFLAITLHLVICCYSRRLLRTSSSSELQAFLYGILSQINIIFPDNFSIRSQKIPLCSSFRHHSSSIFAFFSKLVEPWTKKHLLKTKTSKETISRKLLLLFSALFELFIQSTPPKNQLLGLN